MHLVIGVKNCYYSHYIYFSAHIFPNQLRFSSTLIFLLPTDLIEVVVLVVCSAFKNVAH